MVVDKCPGCGESGLDLFQDGFAALADISQGRIDVNWQWTPCGMSNPLQVHLKEGASQWWFSAQVVGANKVREHLVFPAPASLAHLCSQSLFGACGS